MIQINPLKSYIDGGVRAALTTPPSASLVFDLPGKAIWVKGVKLKGTDHTYTFSHDNYITLTNTPDSNESEDIKIGVNTSALKSAIDTTYGVVSTTTNGLAPKFTSGNKLAATAATTYYFLGWAGTTLKWYQAPFRNIRINSETTDRLGVNNTDPLIISSGNGISVTWDSTNKKIIITNTKPDVNHNTDRTGIKLATVSGTKKTDSTLILANSTLGLNIQGGTNKFLIGDETNYIEVPVVPSVSNKDATIGTALTTIATIAGVDIKAKIALYSLYNHTHSVKINGSTKTITASGTIDLGNYLPLSGGTMTGSIYIPGLSATIIHTTNNSSNYIYISELLTGSSKSETNYQASIGWHNTGGSGNGALILVPYAQNSDPWLGNVGLYIAQNSLKFNGTAVSLSGHTHAWNSLTHSSTTENQAILTNGSANGWKLYTLNISGWNNAANNAHSHSNKSVLDGITSTLVSNWNTAYNFINTISGTDTDKVINKWDEIVNFLTGITEDNKLNTLLNSKLSILLLSTKDILTTKTNNALFWINTVSTASSITTGPFTDHPYALLSVTNYSQNDTNGKFFYRSRLAFSSAGDLKVASCHHQDEYKLDDTWYNVLTSKNSGINGSTIKLNGTSITVYSSNTADGRYVKKTGDTMTGDLYINTNIYGPVVGNNPRNIYGSGFYFYNCNSSTTSTYNFGLYQWNNEFQFTYRTSADNRHKGTSFTIQGSNGQVAFAKTPKVGSTLVSLEGHTHSYLPLSGGTMTLGEGLKFHADDNYFGSNSDARIISLLDGNGSTCDGGLIIDERCTNNGTTTVTELLRIRDNEFKWKGLNILHSGNSSVTKSGQTLTVTINDTSQSLTNNTYNFSGVSFTSGNLNTAEHNANNITSNGVWYYTSNGPTTSLGASTNDGALYSQAYSSSWVGQIAQDYRDGDLFTRSKNNGTWTTWKKIAYINDIQIVTNYYWADLKISNNSNAATNPTVALLKATTGVQIGGTADYGWYLYNNRICAGINVARDINTGSLLVSSAWADSSKVPTNGIYSKGNILTAGGFIKSGSSNSYILLGAGGHKAVSDFATSGHTHNYLPLSGGTLSGKLNIGSVTTSHATKLEVRTANTTADSVEWGIAVKNPYNNQTNYNLGAGIRIGLGNDTETNKFGGIAYIGTSTYFNSGKLAFYASGAERAYLTSNNLYIGGNAVCHAGNSSVSKSGKTLTVKINGTSQSLTDTNTWRGIQDNLTSSTNTTESLSAKQGYLLANGSARDNTKLPLSGGTMTGVIKSTYTSGSWIGGVTNAILKGEYTGYGAILSMPVKDGRVSLSSYPANDNNIYFGYATTALINAGTNSFNKQMFWDAANNNLHAGVFTGYLSGNASTASKWATARTLTIGNTGKSVDGSGNVSWTLAEIGAATSGHTHTLSLASDTGTSSITLAHGGKYKLTAGGNSVIFTLPTDNNTNPANYYWANIKVSASSSTSTAPQFGKVKINTTSSTYQLNVGGDSYVTGWSRAAKGFYCHDTGVHFTHNGTKGQIAITSNNEFCWGASNNTLYFNYSAPSLGTTVTKYIWNAGSSSTYASHTTGDIILGNMLYQLKRGGYSASWYRGRDTAIIRQTNLYGVTTNTVYAIISSKTYYGSWEISTYLENLYFSYVTDTAFNNANGTYIPPLVRIASDACVYATHFYESSDIRYKKILRNLSINSNTIATLPLFDFKWIENNIIGTGTSALAVLLILPNLVSGTDKLTLDYGVLGTIAGITACKELVTLKSELLQLKEKVKELEDKLRKYENI